MRLRKDTSNNAIITKSLIVINIGVARRVSPIPVWLDLRLCCEPIMLPSYPAYAFVHRRHVPRLLSLALVCLIFALMGHSSFASTYVQFLYMNASEDGASGGHAALKIEDEVFHFEHIPPGWLRIKRDGFAQFRDQYITRENRSMDVHHVEVSEDTKNLLREHFNRMLLIEDEQFDRYDALENDRKLLNALLNLSNHGDRKLDNAKRIELKGAGLFLPEGWQFTTTNQTHRTHVEDASIARLKGRVLLAYGNDFVHSKTREILSQLETLKPTSYPFSDVGLAEDSFRSAGYSFSNRYADLLSRLVALQVLEYGLPLHEGVIIHTNGNDFQLTEKEKLSLSFYRDQLKNQLVELLIKPRTDWGYPFLLSMARLIALEQTISSGQWVVLNWATLGKDARPGNPRNLAESTFEAYTSARARFETAKAILIGKDVVDEWSYLHLEQAANQFIELGNAMREGRAVNWPGMNFLPSYSASVGLVPIAVAPTELQAALDGLKNYSTNYEDNLTKLYSYHLIGRNCASEIFRVIAQAMEQAYQINPVQQNQTPFDEAIETESTRRLGGYISGQGLEFIPFVSSRIVNGTWRVSFSEREPSYRLRYLEQAKQQENPLWVSWRESNVFSSRLYRWHGHDPAFVFFTDDLTLTRPLAGGFNLVAGLAQGVAGLLTSLWDGGENLHLGVKGVIISLPELFFFNIRKGTFPATINWVE